MHSLLKHYFSKLFSVEPKDYSQIYEEVSQGARPSGLFYLMNALAALVAGFGLLANSTAVVIGAMLIAMMLRPISGIALALTCLDWRLLRQAVLALLSGIALVLGIGWLLGTLNPDIMPTNEILSRTLPTTLDLMVALCGGLAGALAIITPRLSVAVVGVGVATALVPPLVAAGILFSHELWFKGAGAILLAVTNMVAIQLASSLVFWSSGLQKMANSQQAGFLRTHLATLALISFIGIYLSFSLNHQIKLQTRDRLIEKISKEAFEPSDKPQATTTHHNRVIQVQISSAANNFQHFIPLMGTLLPAPVTVTPTVSPVRDSMAYITIRGDRPPLPEQLLRIEKLLPRDLNG